MKKVFLSIALVTGIFATANIQATNSTVEQPITEVTFNDDGFVDVKFDELNEKVQDAVRAVAEYYDLNALQYNAEKEITKVVCTKKDDQSQRIFYFDVEGKEIVMKEQKVTQQQEEQPSSESLYISRVEAV